ncbi:MAG: porin [Cytophagales bacterium]|nr:porin [Cytophagales bacterium]
MRKSILIVIATVFLISGNMVAQEKAESKKEPKSYKPIRITLSEDGQYYLRVLTWAQIWTTHVNNNPGTIGNDLQPDNTSTNIGIRRARMLFWAQMGPRWMILTHFGMNNQTFNKGGVSGTNGKKPQLYMHDVWTEFMVVPKKLYIGTGLHYWNGVSRAANFSTLNFMTLDAPIFNWYSIETNDQFARQLGIYIKGQLNRLDYRLALNQPFQNGRNPYLQTQKTTNSFNDELAAKNAATDTWSQAGYFKLMLKDIAAGKLPYEIGLCMDGQELLNIGAGFYNHPNSTYTLDPGTGNDSLKFYNQTIFGLDIFYNHAVGNKGYIFNAYGLFQNMNYGKNYLRNIGVFNTSNMIGNQEQLGDEYANRSAMGAGNVQPTLGTGNILYGQLGLRFPRFENGAAFMPYLTGTYKNFEAIDEPSFQYDIGLNYFINKHYAKITLQYGVRPIYKFDASQENGISQNGLKGQLTLQTHIWL